jgi:hypothetical protein
MADETGAAAGTADATDGTQDTTPGGSPAPGEDRDPQDMLADAVTAGDEDDDDSGDPAKALIKAQAEAKKWRDIQQKTEQRANKAAVTARANADAARELAEIKDRDKTDLQRQTDRAVQAEQRAADAEGLYHRTLAAATYGVPPTLIGQISGATEDECNASAEAIAAAISEAADERAAAAIKAAGAGVVMRGQRPVESLRPGAVPAGTEPQTPDGWLRSALVRQ